MSNFIDCTGNCCVGDEIIFERAVFSGNYFKPKFSHFETIEGKIIKDSYGAEKQQHTFTILKEDGDKMRIKGRNLYKRGVKRKIWKDENKRKEVLDEKYKRGNEARKLRDERKFG